MVERTGKKEEDFKKACVKMRLSGMGIKEICEARKIWPPQLNRWMKQYGDAPEFAELKRARDMEKKPHSRVSKLPSDLLDVPRTEDDKVDVARFVRRRRDHSYTLYMNPLTGKFDKYCLEL